MADWLRGGTHRIQRLNVRMHRQQSGPRCLTVAGTRSDESARGGAANETPSVPPPSGQEEASNENEPVRSGKPDDQSAAEEADVERVIQSIDTGNGYHKKIELLKDGGKRVTITDPNGNATVRKIEYEGTISSVSGSEITVQLEHGGEKTIEIPPNIIVDDETGQGFKIGTEIEWVVDPVGTIRKVQLDD